MTMCNRTPDCITEITAGISGIMFYLALAFLIAWIWTDATVILNACLTAGIAWIVLSVIASAWRQPT